ncbi:MAG: isoprenylcysteine carboxylmethyltransferase family protein [Candidatus Bathyarchaeota archaeon]|nr:MAG: isoprenylcysteine carboxylmethyltransferase family protein [Candidatus Bathyarchaeota archaeon]
MFTEFTLCALGMVTIVPLHFVSVEHQKLETRFGKEMGRRIGEGLGLVSGWGFFLFWIGLWVFPQPRFHIPTGPLNPSINLPFTEISIPLLHMLLSMILLLPGGYLGLFAVRKTSLKVAETHRTERIVTDGVYSVVRHPQYLGGFLAHVGVSILLSAWFSTIITPLIFLLLLLISYKEEKELVKEFGSEYEEYKGKVSMFIPRLL